MTSQMSNTISKENLTWLLNVANDMRAYHGDELLEDLPKSIPGNSSRCIIANAFNYGCHVGLSGTGTITFNNLEDRNAYMEVMELEFSDYDFEVLEDGTFDDLSTFGPNRIYIGYSAPMTPELLKIALQFDDINDIFFGYIWEDDDYEFNWVDEKYYHRETGVSTSDPVMFD
jgi:hypothetical protein